MDTNKVLDNVDVKRRELMVAGLASAAVLVTTSGSGAQAAEEKGKAAAKGSTRKVIKEIESMIPGYAKVSLRENTYAPGATTKNTMKNDMICECTLGSLEVKQDGKMFIANKGDIWSCKVGTVEENTNKGSTPAIMRVFDLLKA